MIGQRLAVAAAVLLVATARLLPVLSGDGFPAGDGGLFAVMASDLRTAFPQFPSITSYNASWIPFAYPPLGPMVLAAMPGDPIVSEILLTSATSLASVAAFFLLARSVLVDRVATAVATVVFGLLPHAWLVLGGDGVRGLFLTLLLLAVWRAWHLGRRPSVADSLAVGALSGLALLSHPYAYTVLPVSMVVVWLAQPSRASVRLLLLAAAVALLVSGPWLALTLARHGVEPLLSALVSHDTSALAARAIRFGLTGLPGPDVLGAWAVAGLILASFAGPRLLPMWFIALLVTPGAELRTLSVVVALALGVLARRMVEAAPPLPRLASASLAVVVTAALSYAAIYSTDRSANYRVVSTADRAAAEWMSTNLDPGSRVAILSAQSSTSVEEWLPALTGLHSVGTYQGSEWLAPASWEQRLDANRQLGRCRSIACIPRGVDVLFVSSEVSDGIVGAPTAVYSAGARIYQIPRQK